MPTCRKCGGSHPNFYKVCPPVRALPEVQYRKDSAPDGYHLSTRWGVNTRGRPVFYNPELAPIKRHGRLTGPDGKPYVPNPEPPLAA